jgi:hypothetical protein
MKYYVQAPESWDVYGPLWAHKHQVKDTHGNIVLLGISFTQDKSNNNAYKFSKEEIVENKFDCGIFQLRKVEK